MGGVVDPYLALFDSAGNLITEDDDGGAGRGSMITFTPTVTGTYSLYATSFYTIDGESPSVDAGAYTINMWSPSADVPGTTNVAASLAGAATMTIGTTFGNIDFAGDNDYFRIEVKAGEVYTFSYSGGVWGAGDFDGEAGENLATLSLYSATGASLGSNLNYESGVSYFASTNTTIYLRAAGYSTTTGGYTIDVEKVDPSTRDVLESLRWNSADNIDTVMVDGVPTAYVYFGGAGENFGEKAPNGTPLLTSGWTPVQQAAVMHALQTQYTPITGIQYIVTTDVNIAEFRMLTVPTATYGARFYPQDPAYGTQQGIGTFNLGSGGFGAFPQSLEQGGYSYAVILHEFGHAHGVAHPHDTGGGSEVMLGVNGSTGSLGVYNLNQGVYTVMSYNDAWQLHPNGPSAFTIAGIDNGWSGSLSALDIAVLQERYGRHAHNTGDTVYALTHVVDDAFYQTIWDTGGTDTIAYSGGLSATIDLTAATLDYTPTGGGVLSFLLNDPNNMPTNSFRVRGGYTIANGVVIENATGGFGTDVLLGNSAANVLSGNAGNDVLEGRGGDDTLNGGSGDDVMRGGTGNDGYIVDSAGDAVTELAGEGDDTVSSSVDYTLTANVEDLVLTGTAVRGTGNDLDNVITGNAENNVLNGGRGLDVYTGGAGDDTFVIGDLGSLTATKKMGSIALEVITDFDSAGNDVIDLSGLRGFTFKGTGANKAAGDLTYKVYDSVNGAENALGFDIDGIEGPSSFSGPVTVVFANVDGGAADLALILLNSNGVSADDFIGLSGSAFGASADSFGSPRGGFELQQTVMIA